MSDPNRIGGIRGPDGLTLADVVNSLNNVVAGIGDMTTSLTAVISRLDIAQGQNGSLVTLLTDLRNATGLVSGDPANYTVRRLLDEIHTCLCGPLDPADGSGDPTPPPQDEPPAVGCTSYARIQRVSFWQRQPDASIGGTAYNVFAPMFTYNPAEQGWNLGPVGSGTTRRAHEQNRRNEPIFYCLVWNFGGNVRPFAIARTVGGGYTGIADGNSGLTIPYGHTWGTQVPNFGNFAEDFPAGQFQQPDGWQARYINWFFYFPASVADPPLSAWLRYNVAA